MKIKPQYRRIASDGKITIDGITKELIRPKNPLFVPQKFGKMRTAAHTYEFSNRSQELYKLIHIDFKLVNKSHTKIQFER